MWHFDPRGFVSIVAYDPKHDKMKDSEFKKISKNSAETHLLVRARIKEDLDWMKTAVPNLHIETDKSADYSFRALVSRKKMKQLLAESVDQIDYDSHFKEVADKRSPQATGRHSAMMKCWSAMAALQPYSPYGGSVYSYGTTTTGGTSYSSAPARTASLPTTSVHTDGVADVEAFIEAYLTSEGDQTFRNGGGPRTGFKEGDDVETYSGAAKVLEVTPRKEGKAELVKVKMVAGGRVTSFLSNYMQPLELPPIVIEVEDEILSILDDEFLTLKGGERYDLDWAYDAFGKVVKAKQQISDFPQDRFPELDDEAFELLQRMMEIEDSGLEVTDTALAEAYDEILWESSNDAERLAHFGGMESVPAKYEQAAIKLFSDLANTPN